jgi:hypothetical protein
LSENPENMMPRDEATSRLAHPQRCAVCLGGQGFFVWKELLGSHTWSALEGHFKGQAGMTGDILAGMIQDPRHRTLDHFTEMLAQGEGSTEMGSAFSVMLFARQTVSPQPQFLVEDGLVEMLEHTDISDDIPVSVLTLPYPRCYLELGRARATGLRVPNPSTGLHVLEGAYLETGTSVERGPGIFVMLTGSPLGHDNAMDDATNSLFVSTANPDESLRTALLNARKSSAELATELGLVPDMPEHFEHEFEALKLLAKVLLYLNLPQARKDVRKELTQARQAAVAKKNPAKRARAEKELRRLADYILITAPPEQREPDVDAGGRGVKSHWRRGHYRLQAHGPRYSLRKVLFVQPMLVGSIESSAGAPQYHLKP